MSKRLSADQRSRIVLALRVGSTFEVAAQSAGVHVNTVSNWVRRGREDLAAGKRSVFSEFWEQCQTTQAQHIVALEGVVTKAAIRDEDWKAAGWLLERKRPAEYGRKDQVTVQVRQAVVADLLDHLQGRLDADTYERVLAALADDGGPPADGGPRALAPEYA